MCPNCPRAILDSFSNCPRSIWALYQGNLCKIPLLFLLWVVLQVKYYSCLKYPHPIFYNTFTYMASIDGIHLLMWPEYTNYLFLHSQRTTISLIGCSTLLKHFLEFGVRHARMMSHIVKYPGGFRQKS